VERFSGVLATEIKHTKIVVVTFRPGTVNTPMQAEIRRTPAHLFPKVARWEAMYTEGRLHLPMTPAYAILWLASHFAQDCNGQLFDMDDVVFQQRLSSDLDVPIR
jgi:NAD(P)-dependent dehydrogenase (short-subunit alcohol dehydrogenase family)